MSVEVENYVNEPTCNKRTHKRNIFSLNDSDIQVLWDYVSEFIESTMLKQKGVHIPGLGTFSFNQVSLDIGQNKCVVLQRPLFLLSEKICQNHNLKQHRTQVTGSIPVVTLNYSSLMLKSSYSRDHVETCVRELITAANSSIASQSATELVFTKIGRLQVRNQQVKFKFYKSFINSLDGSGKIMNTMQNRPGTADSVMSERPPTRSFSNIIPLPKISSFNDCQKLETINELDVFQSKHPDSAGMQNILKLDLNNNQNIYQDEGEDTNYVNIMNESNNLDEIPNAIEMISNSTCSVDSHSKTNEPLESGEYNEQLYHDAITSDTNDSLTTIDMDHKALPTPKPPSRSSLLSQTKRPASVYSNSRPSTSASSSCGHSGPAGQDLCYVCYQREKRNVPISFSEQLKEREKEEERVLQAFQNMKDTEHFLKEQENLLSKKYDSQKVSAFNAGVADALRTQQKSKDPNKYRSYLFQKRPLTPPRTIMQNLLSSELDKQVEWKVSTKKKNNEEEAFVERLEQFQLAEDLAKQREQYIKDKEKSKDLYKKALDTQINSKQLPIPKFQPDSEEPFFGKNDVTQDKLLEKRVKAREISKDQLEAAEHKKRDSLIKKIQEQTHEEKVLDKVKHDLIEDRAGRYQRALQNRLKLENEWERAKEEKKERDLMERLKISMPDKVLMHEQCDKYTRCTQCKRKVHNLGQSSIWKETYFNTGTRYIY